ncbi:MAG TPA: hypothetical protein PLD23_04935 [Armatimonadota bacterium]|nr:hypothetical protein [Armatimonadota bacterium]
MALPKETLTALQIRRGFRHPGALEAEVLREALQRAAASGDAIESIGWVFARIRDPERALAVAARLVLRRAMSGDHLEYLIGAASLRYRNRVARRVRRIV